jgi:hypothetical protein
MPSILNLEDADIADEKSIWPLPRNKYCVISPDLRATWFGKWGQKGSVWLKIEWDEDSNWFSVSSEYSGEVPPWLEYLDGGWGSLLAPTNDGDCLNFLLKHGVSPGQPFLIYFSYEVIRETFGDYDQEFDYEVVRKEKWSKEKELQSWNRWLSLNETYL